MRGAALALRAERTRIGRYRDRTCTTLDDSLRRPTAGIPVRPPGDARIASDDPTTIGYIGELNSGASAVSIPLLNALGIAQVTPGATAVGLTSDAPGRTPASRRSTTRPLAARSSGWCRPIWCRRGCRSRCSDDSAAGRPMWSTTRTRSMATMPPPARSSRRPRSKVCASPAEQPFDPKRRQLRIARPGDRAERRRLPPDRGDPRPGTAALTDQLAAAVPGVRLFAHQRPCPEQLHRSGRRRDPARRSTRGS